jgi:hypothetical protein
MRYSVQLAARAEVERRSASRAARTIRLHCRAKERKWGVGELHGECVSHYYCR